MQLDIANPAAGVSAGLAKAVSLAGTPNEYTTPALVVQRLQRTYRVSELHAETIAFLASIGPKEGR